MDQITISNEISALYELKTISNYTEALLTNFFPEIDRNLEFRVNKMENH